MVRLFSFFWDHHSKMTCLCRLFCFTNVFKIKCVNCKTISVNNKLKNIFLIVMSDEPQASKSSVSDTAKVLKDNYV